MRGRKEERGREGTTTTEEGMREEEWRDSTLIMRLTGEEESHR